MLAAVYLSARRLGLSDAERDGLVGVLEGLERGWFVHLRPGEVAGDYSVGFAFNMGWFDCRTTACIAGWSDLMHGTRFVRGYSGRSKRKGTLGRALQDLFYGREGRQHFELSEITTGQAAAALRNYLTTGFPLWGEVLSEIGASAR